MAGTYLGLYLNDSHLLLQMFLNMKIQLTKISDSEYTPHPILSFLLLSFLLPSQLHYLISPSSPIPILSYPHPLLSPSSPIPILSYPHPPLSYPLRSPFPYLSSPFPYLSYPIFRLLSLPILSFPFPILSFPLPPSASLCHPPCFRVGRCQKPSLHL